MIDGVRVLTVYAFSTENWQREANEVGTLMNIFAKYADSFRKEALAKNVKVNVLVTGMQRKIFVTSLLQLRFCEDDGKLPPRVKSAIDELQNATNLCTGFTVNICLSYGSRGEITQACASIGKSLVSGELDVRDVTEDLISKHLTTKDYPGLLSMIK